MIEAEEVLQRVCVTFLLLEFFDELELTVEEVLVTTPETDEGAGHVLATQLRLASSEVYSCGLHGVQRCGKNRHLIISLHLEVVELRKFVGGTSRFNDLRDTDVSCGLCLLGQLLDRLGDSTCHNSHSQERCDHRDQKDEADSDRDELLLTIDVSDHVTEAQKRGTDRVQWLVRLDNPVEVGKGEVEWVASGECRRVRRNPLGSAGEAVVHCIHGHTGLAGIEGLWVEQDVWIVLEKGVSKRDIRSIVDDHEVERLFG